MGSTLTASVTNTNSASLSYQWYRGSSAISGATGSSYALVAADANSIMKVVVTATKTNYNNASWEDTTDAANNSYASTLAGYVCPDEGSTLTVNSTLGVIMIFLFLT